MDAAMKVAVAKEIDPSEPRGRGRAPSHCRLCWCSSWPRGVRQRARLLADHRFPIQILQRERDERAKLGN